jgi:hypothetical protein
MTLARELAAVAERRRLATVIQVIRPARTATPSRIHSQSRLVLDPVLGVADEVGEAADADVAGAVVGAAVVGAAVVGAAVVGAAVVGGAVVGGAVVGGAVVASAVVGSAVVAGAVVAAAVVAPPPVAAPARLVRLLITLLALLPQPTASTETARMAARRERLFALCRMVVLPR